MDQNPQDDQRLDDVVIPDEQPEEQPQEESPVDEPQDDGPLDLESVERFKFAGREWTPKEMQDAYLMQADYTRKTQELADERKYMGALQADLAAVRENPKLESEFKKLYPEKYHAYLGYVLPDKRVEESGDQVPKEVLTKLEKMEKFIESQQSKEEELKVQEYSNWIADQEAKHTKKYELANPVDVWTRIQAGMEQGQFKESDVNEKMVEQYFKQSHEQTQKVFDNYSKKQFENNKQVNSKAKDTGKGGNSPGQAPRKLRLDEVDDVLIKDLQAKGY